MIFWLILISKILKNLKNLNHTPRKWRIYTRLNNINFFQKKNKKKIYFLIIYENKLIEQKKKNTSKILFILISKSGNTVETLTNIFGLNIIKNKSKNNIVISEKKNNTLYLMSKNLGLYYIEQKTL